MRAGHRPILLLLPWLLSACDCGDGQAASDETVEPLGYEMTGCAEIPEAGVCELDEEARELTVFVRSRQPVEVAFDQGEPTPVEAKKVQDGQRLAVEVPAGVERLVLRSGTGRAEITIRPTRVPERVAALLALRSEGKLDALEEGIDAWEAELDASDDPDVHCDRARIHGLRARLAFSRQEPEEVVSFYERSVPVLLECGRLSEALDDAMAEAFVRVELLRDYAGARKALDLLDRESPPYPWMAAWGRYHRAMLLLQTGALGEAVEVLDDVLERAERLDFARVRSAALQLRAWVMGLMGRHHQAASSVEQAAELAEGLPACDRAKLFNNMAWQRLLAAEEGSGDLGPARAWLRQTLELAGPECPNSLRHARVNLAQVDVLEGDLESAQEHLEAAMDGLSGEAGAVRTAMLDLQGRIALEAGKPRRALEVYEELDARAKAAGQAVPAASLGRGKALIALDRGPEAIAALRASEDELDLQVASVSLGMGRDTLTVGRGESAELLVHTLLAEGATGEAFEAARHARARLLWSIPRVASMQRQLTPEERRIRDGAVQRYWALRDAIEAQAEAAWTRPSDELGDAEAAQASKREELEDTLAELFPAVLRRPRPFTVTQGEPILGIFPFRSRTFVFLRDEQNVTALERSGAPPLAELVEPFIERLESARVVRVIGPTERALAAVHTVTLESGKTLGLEVPVLHMVDLHEQGGRGSATGKVFVFDPRGDLRSARREAVWLREHVDTDPGDRWLVGSVATRETLLSALEESGTFHYAGHGVYEDDGWWRSGLLLGEDTVLTIADVLTSQRVPPHVVLLGCETARAREARHVATMGIAQAFVVAGAKHVVATRERIEDDVAYEFSRAYHGRPEGGPVERFHGAQRQLAENGQNWSTFALLVP